MKIEELYNKTCTVKKLNHLFESIKFVRKKIESSQKMITDEAIEINKKVQALVWDYFKKSGYPGLQQRRKGNEEYFFEYGFEGKGFNDQLLFHVDAVLADVRRCLEFCMKFILESDGLDTNKFSFQKLLNEISPSFSGTKNRHSNLLIKIHPEFVSFLNSDRKWLDSLNEKRTQITHYSAHYQTDRILVGMTWDPGVPFWKKPKIGNAKISIFKEPLLPMVKEHINHLDTFMDNVLELKRNILVDIASRKLDLTFFKPKD